MAATDYTYELNVIGDYFSTWKGVTSDHASFHQFSNAQGREVYRVTAKDPSVVPNSVLLRKFCDLKPQMNETQTKLFLLLGSLGLAPKVYFMGKDIWIEEYLDSRQPLCREINQKEIRRMFALKLAALHKVEPGNYCNPEKR